MKSFSELKFLLKHSSVYGIGNMLSQLVAFILLPMYTRYLTPTDYGVMELAGVTIGVIGIVMGVGLSESISRFYFEFKDKKEQNRVISTSYAITVVVSLIALVIIFPFLSDLALLILDTKEYTKLLAISFVSLALGMVIDVGQLYLRVLQKSGTYITISLINLVVGVSLNILFIAVLETGVIGIFYAGLITKLVVGLPLTGYILKKVGFGFNYRLARDMLRYSIPLIPSHIAHAIVNYSDRYFIKFFLSLHDAGVYSIANKIGTALHMLVTSPFIMTFLPRRFELAEQGNAEEQLSIIYDYYMMVIVFIGLVLAVFSSEVIVYMTTPAFYAAADYIPLIVFTMVILGMRYHFEFGILYSKQTKYYMYINIVTSSTHVILNLFLIQLYGLWGALISSIVAVSLNTGLVYLVSQRLHNIPFDNIRSLKLLIVAVAVYGVAVYPVSSYSLVVIAYKLVIITIFPLIVFFTILNDEEKVKVRTLSATLSRSRLK